MSKEIEERLDRLEKALGSFGTDIHEFDSPAQAKAYEKQLEAEQADEAKQVAKLQKQAAAEESTSAGVPANLTARRKPAARRKAAARKPKPVSRTTTTTPVGSGK